MPTCPACDSVRIVVVVGLSRRAFCTACGAAWIQEGALQRSVKRPTPVAPLPESPGHAAPRVTEPA